MKNTTNGYNLVMYDARQIDEKLTSHRYDLKDKNGRLIYRFVFDVMDGRILPYTRVYRTILYEALDGVTRKVLFGIDPSLISIRKYDAEDYMETYMSFTIRPVTSEYYEREILPMPKIPIEIDLWYNAINGSFSLIGVADNAVGVNNATVEAESDEGI